MKKFLTVLFISLGIFGFSNQAAAQKIGYISADEIIMLMPEATKLQADLEAYQKSLYQNANDKQVAFNEALQKFIKDSATMNASLKEVKRNDLQKQSQELANQQQIIAQELEGKRQELAAPIQKKLQEAIEEVAKENGYTYIFPREAVIVAPPKDDIGPLVMKKLNLKAPTAPTTAPAPKQ